jgi:hypothetical protein
MPATRANTAPATTNPEPSGTPATSKLELTDTNPIPATRVNTASAATGPEPSGTFEVKLAATASEGSAQAEWHTLPQKMPAILTGHQPTTTRVERDGKVFWRLRTSGFADAAEAGEFCARIRAGGANCIVMR